MKPVDLLRRLSPLKALVLACITACAGADAPAEEGAAAASETKAGAPGAAGWEYLPLPETVCANGTSTGMAINRAEKADAPLVVFMMGGGACWSAMTCTLGAASNLSKSLGKDEIFADIERVGALFDRTRPGNPFRDASYAFVPYCTGDLHMGDARRTYTFLGKSITIEHRGKRNTEAVAKKLAALYPNPARVVLAGASAGGYATLFQAHRFQATWPGRPLDVLNDSGPPIQPADNTWTDMLQSWRSDIPAPCREFNVDQDVSNILPCLAYTMPDSRLALLSHTTDKVIRAFSFRFEDKDFEHQLRQLEKIAGPKQRMFFVDSSQHVLLKQPTLPRAMSGAELYPWLAQFASGDPAWSHQTR